MVDVVIVVVNMTDVVVIVVVVVDVAIIGVDRVVHTILCQDSLAAKSLSYLLESKRTGKNKVLRIRKVFFTWDLLCKPQ